MMRSEPRSNAATPRHIPVLLEPILDWCRRSTPRIVVDGTLGLGGHARAILESCPTIEKYLGIDRDDEALGLAKQNLEPFANILELVHGTFEQIPEILDERSLESADIVLMDLGVSSYQLGQGSRGFSFQSPGPIDMRMNPRSGSTARDLIATLDEKELARILARYGEVPRAHRIAREMKAALPQLRTTTDLAEVISRATPAALRRKRRIHPATQVFQALRIAVNDELGLLDRGLPGILDRLSPGGLMMVISFHSLEDRRVKRFFKAESLSCICPPEFPRCNCNKQARVEMISRKAIYADDAEVASNPRSRSARLRIARRVGPQTEGSITT